MSADEQLSMAAEARNRWHRTDTELNALRNVHAALDDLALAVTRSETTPADVEAVQSALDSLGGTDEDRRAGLAFLAEPVFEDDRTLQAEFEARGPITNAAESVASSLSGYVTGDRSWSAVTAAVDSILSPDSEHGTIDPDEVEQLTTLFGLAVEAGIAHRETQERTLQDALEAAYEDLDDPLPELDGQPLALLPVNLETRFVDRNGGRSFVEEEESPAELLVRVFPDQIHTDSHEEELTDDEVEWGKYFWTVLWFARYPDPAVVPADTESDHLTERVPSERLREIVVDLLGDVEAGKFSTQHHRRYTELKERAWSKLVDRFGRERAAYVVHSLRPTDMDLAIDLLTQPPEPPGGDGEDDQLAVTLRTAETTAAVEAQVEFAADEMEKAAIFGDQEGTADSFDEDAVAEALDDEGEVGTEGLHGGTTMHDQYEPARDVAEHVPEDIDSAVDAGNDELPEELPALEFPTVSRRPASWTKSARAKLLPDRWIAVAEWEDAAGNVERAAIAGDPIRDPLQFGPGMESVAGSHTEASESPAPEGTEWLVDFEAAEAVGMGLRIRLSALAGFDARRGFDRLSVIGVKASMPAGETPDAVADLLDAHHYTDGLAFVEQGMASNNHEDSSGYRDSVPPSESMAVECSPPKVTPGDRSDSDLLTRTLAIDRGGGIDHIFANVARADATQQRDARHMNSALWPATLGYYRQNILVDNSFADNPSLWEATPTTSSTVDKHLLWLDAYRRHFVRYVRGSGPLPTLRVGKHPYGILPAMAVETDRDLTILDPDVLDTLEDRTIDDITQQGYELEDLAGGGVDPETLVEAGATADDVVAAGARPTHLMANAVEEDVQISQAQIAPDAVVRDGIGLTETSKLTEKRLDEVGITGTDLERAGITSQELGRGAVNERQLEEADITTKQLGELLLREDVRKLGITPDALHRAGVTPAGLLRGEFTSEQVQRLGLDTRAVADAVLTPELKSAGITPKRLEDADISPIDLVNGEVDNHSLRQAGMDPDTVTTALLPEELREAGVTADVLMGAGVTVDDLFNGTVDAEQLREVGITTESVADDLLPAAFLDAGITPTALEDAGVTPAAIVNGAVTPADLKAAGVDPDTLNDAGVLPDTLVAVGDTLGDLMAAGVDPDALLSGDVTPDSLTDAGIEPKLLVEAGLAPKRIVEAGVEVVNIAADGILSVQELADAGASPAQLARAGATVADLASGDVPAREIVQAGFHAYDLLETGFDALGLTEGGARPSQLREAGVDAGTLVAAGKSAGSMRVAGYDASELIDAGYAAEELLNGGYSADELEAAGLDTREARQQARSASELLAAGTAPAQLREAGFSPDQLLDAGISTEELVEAGFTAGDLVDAGLTVVDLAEAGIAIGELRAAGADIETLLEAGVEPSTLRETGVTAATLLDHGFDPADLVDVGFLDVELESAGVDVESLFEDEDVYREPPGTIPDDIRYAVAVDEEVTQAERDTYRFSFDPATPRAGPGPGANLDVAGVPDAPGKISTGESTDSGDSDNRTGDSDNRTDGGISHQDVQMPVVKTVAIDDNIDDRLTRRLSGFGTHWETAANQLPFGSAVDEDDLLNALMRTARSVDVRHQTIVYSGEHNAGVQNPTTVSQASVTGHKNAVTSALETAEATDLDPRVGYLYPWDVTEADRDDETTLVSYYQAHLARYGEYQGIVDSQSDVDSDIGDFLDIVLDRSWRDVHELGHPLEWGENPRNMHDGMPLKGSITDNIGMDFGEFWDLSDGEKEGQLVRILEDSDDPMSLFDELFHSHETTSKPQLLARNKEDYGDTGALRSFLRILLQFGTLQAYLTARRRLGAAYDDEPEGWPEPSTLDGTVKGPIDSLDDEAPEQLHAHPDINGEHITYGEVLEIAAADYASTTSLDPRLSEFTDSLAYLRASDPADLAEQMHQTLDLASHRLDAWWTSLATKELFELREVQGTLDGDRLDHDKWDGAGGDIPRATTEPGIVGDIDTSGKELTDTGTSNTHHGEKSSTADSETDVETVGYEQYNPGDVTQASNIAGNAFDVEDDDSATDGGNTDWEKTGIDEETQVVDDIQVDDSTQVVDDTQVIDDTQLVDDTQVDDVAKAMQDVGDGENTGDSGDVASRDDPEPTDVSDRAAEEPGLYVGGYGFVENLQVDLDPDKNPEYIHAPSEQHALTAALLRSGSEAHDLDEGENVMQTNLSPDRVRSGLWLIRGVRRGQSPGELLGYRFERRLHEETLADPGDRDRDDTVNLMQYLHVFREEFPTTVEKIERPDDPRDGSDAESNGDDDSSDEEDDEDGAPADAVDGYKLLKEWDEYPFGRGEDLPGDAPELAVIESIVEELQRTVQSARDLLTAESVHNLGRGNYDKVGSSLSAIAKGEPFPDPDVIRTPRSETGFSHRQAVLMDAIGEEPADRPRSRAEPALATWVKTMLPDTDTVECRATVRWIDSEENSHEESATITLAEMELGPLDILYLFGADADAARSELETRLGYRLLRKSTSDDVPGDATVELALRETESPEATSMADVLELTRSLRELVQEARPATAEDLAHPSEASGKGYDDQSVAELTDRADVAAERLDDLSLIIENRLSVLDPDETLKNTRDKEAATDGYSDEETEEPSEGETNEPAEGETAGQRTLTTQADALNYAALNAYSEVPYETVESVANSIDPTAIHDELETFANALPAGPATESRITAPVTPKNTTNATIEGDLTQKIAIPTAGDESSESENGGNNDSENDGDNDSESEDSENGDSFYGDLGGATAHPVDIGDEDLDLTLDDSGSGFLGEDPEDAANVTEEKLHPAGIHREEIRRRQFERDFDTAESDTGTDVPTAGESTGDEEAGESEGVDETVGTVPDGIVGKTVTVNLWGTDGISAFERKDTTTVTEDGTFSIQFDLSDIEPGTPFTVVASVDGTVEFAADGRILAAEFVGSDPQTVLDEECPNLRKLVWLFDRYPRLSTADGPAGELADEVATADWASLTDERATMETSDVLTAEHLSAIDSLLDVQDTDLEAVAEAAKTLADPVVSTQLDRLVTVGDADPIEGQPVVYHPQPALTTARARLRRLVDAPELYNQGYPSRFLAYDPSAAVALDSPVPGMAAYLDAFLAGSDWVARYLDGTVEDPARMLADLTAWLHDPGTVEDQAALESAFDAVAADIDDLPALAGLFGHLPPEDDGETLSTFATYLQEFAGGVIGSSPSYPDGTDAKQVFDGLQSDAATELSTTITEERAVFDALTTGPDGAAAFREGMLEGLREPMATLANYGVLGATPKTPRGGTPAVEAELVEQGWAVLTRVEGRLEKLADLETPPDDEPNALDTDDHVELQIARLEAIFGDGFTALAPFEPTNQSELVATFTSDELIPDDAGPAAEKVLQRAASFRDRVDDYREARTYGEVLTGTPAEQLTVGQVPHEPGDTWVGVDGVDPKPNRLSLMVQFGPGLDPAGTGGRMTGLFVDKWHESIPEESETTGVALHYDDPGNRAPNSVLLVPPASEDGWSIDDLASTVAETSTWSKRRAVDFGDMHGIDHMLPGLYLPITGAKERQSLVDLRMLEWFDWNVPSALLDAAFVRTSIEQAGTLQNYGGEI